MSPSDSAVDGFMGIALRRVEDNTFVLVKTMPGDNNAGGWTATTMTQAELAPYANDVPNPDEVTVNIPASNAPGGKLFARIKATLP
jgi:hypothetical protein